MIQKIVEVKDIGRFAKLQIGRGNNNSDFRKLTLIFGQNGDGKSTLADVIRAASRRERLLERHRLGAASSPTVHLQLTSGPLRKLAGVWSGPVLKAEVFDKEFVDRNVHFGGEVQAEQRQNLLQLALGEAEVAAAKEVDDIAAHVSKVVADRAAAVKQLEPLVMGTGLTTDEFMALPIQADAPGAISTIDHALANAKRAKPIRDRGFLSRLPMPQSPDWAALEAVLAVTVESLSESAKSAVVDHLERRLGDANARSWVQNGIRYQGADSACPFCGQSTANSELVGAYSKYFSDAYDKHVAKLRAAADLARGRRDSWSSLDSVVSSNETSRDFWLAVTGEPAPVFDGPTLGERWREAMTTAERLLAQKLADPTKPIEASSLLADSERDTSTVVSAISAHNAAIDAYNATIQQSKTATGTASPQSLEAQKRKIQAAVQRHQPKIAAIAESIGTFDVEKKQLERKKTDARKRLDAARASRLAGFETDVNALLDRLGAAFRIQEFKSVLPGGRPSAEYALRVGSGAVSATARRGDSPSFRTVLSDGDKSTLALALFVAAARRSPSIAETTLVFDDPMTSLDDNRTHATKELLRELADLAGQVIVLSHQPRFLLETGRDRAPSELRTLKISASATGQQIVECDLRSECRSDYERRMDQLREFANQKGSTSESEIRASIRVVLEEYLRTRHPHMWGDNTWLGDFVKSGQKHPVLASTYDWAELENLSQFSSQGHHAANTVRFIPVSTAELRNYAKRAYKFISASFPD